MQNTKALGLFSFLFFSFGFITCLNDLLVPHLKNSFNLTYTQSILVQFCFFAAYFISSAPAGKLIERIGYKNGVIVGLMVMSVGCLGFLPAAYIHTFSLFLLALFVLASGIALLQVAANPYIARLGNPLTASRRLTLVQAFNSLGTAIAPILGGILIFRANTHNAESVVIPYLGLAVILLLLIALVKGTQLPEIKEEETTEKSQGRVRDYPQLVLGVLGIFFYVGSEVSIGSFLVSLMGEAEMGSIPEMVAAKYVAIYWTGAMVGRFIGSVYMQKIGPALTLFLHSVTASLLILFSFFITGETALACLLFVGFCNSIMFPTIFTQALDNVGGLTKRGSALLCMAIVGGAIIPLIQGLVADASSIRTSYIVPLFGYIFITYFAWFRMKQK